MKLKEWAYENGYGELYEEYAEMCEDIAQECVEEGYPSHGENYELRVEQIKSWFPELFPDDDWVTLVDMEDDEW